MSFSPVVPLGGYAGWRYLSRTLDAQRATQEQSTENRVVADYFRDRIGAVKTAEALVSDRRLLNVALGAYGLEADIDNRFFVRKVLEGSRFDETALANRLADKSYLDLNKAFGFGDYETPNTQLSDFADRMLERYATRQIEISVGAQNSDLRLALNAKRSLPELAVTEMTEKGHWYSVLGSEPLRTVFETALGLPSSFAGLDIDRQVSILRDRAERTWGDAGIAQFADPEKVEDLIRRFLVRSENSVGLSTTAPGYGALQLLQGAGGGAGVLSLLA